MNHISIQEAISHNEFYLLDNSMHYRLSKSFHLKSLKLALVQNLDPQGKGAMNIFRSLVQYLPYKYSFVQQQLAWRNNAMTQVTYNHSSQVTVSYLTNRVQNFCCVINALTIFHSIKL